MAIMKYALFQSDSNLSGIQQFAKLAAAVADVDDPLLDFQEPDDSGIDSDDPSPLALQASPFLEVL